MVTMAWDPFRQLEAMRREIEQTLADFGNGNRPDARAAFRPQVEPRTYPLTNMSEDDDNVYVEALAPGLDPESIQVTAVEGTLQIAGEKSPVSQQIKPEAFHRNERGAGRFVRNMSLPAGVDSDKITAKYTNGLLLITLPKQESAKPRKINVNVA